MVIGRNRTGKPFEHSFAALCCGGIREFALFSATPHVQVRGSFTWAQHSWIRVAGSLAEILLFPFMLLTAPSTCSGRLAVEVTGIFAAIELIGWTASALAYPNGPRDSGRRIVHGGVPNKAFVTALKASARAHWRSRCRDSCRRGKSGMKRSFQFIQIGIMAGALSLVPAVAQTGSNPNSGSASGSAVSTPSNPNNRGGSTANASGNDTTTANPGSANPGTVANSGQTVPGTDMNDASRSAANYPHDHGFNFGWLGLVGLVGLLGLRRPHANTVDRYEARSIDNTGPSEVR